MLFRNTDKMGQQLKQECQPQKHSTHHKPLDLLQDSPLPFDEEYRWIFLADQKGVTFPDPEIRLCSGSLFQQIVQRSIGQI